MDTASFVDEVSSSSSSTDDASSSSIMMLALGIVGLRAVCFVTSFLLSIVRFCIVWNEIFRLHQPVQLDLVTKMYEPTNKATATATTTTSSPPTTTGATTTGKTPSGSVVPEETCPICLVPYGTFTRTQLQTDTKHNQRNDKKTACTHTQTSTSSSSSIEGGEGGRAVTRESQEEEDEEEEEQSWRLVREHIRPASFFS